MSGKVITWAFIVLMLPLEVACQKVDRSAVGRDEGVRPAATPAIITTDGGVEMVLIPAGRFVMGSDHGPADEAPTHEVVLSAFLMDRCEVSQAVYAHLEPINGSHFKGDDLPTEMVSWGKAALYCNMRSEAEGLQPCYNDVGECDFSASGYRLPTEAEWEYACRAGSTAAYGYGSDPSELSQYGWFAQNAAKKTHPVGTKRANGWGLYDMQGNVAEWCNDFYAEDYYRHSPSENPPGPREGERRVLRGGHWNASAEACRSAARAGEEPGFSDACFARDAIGFRCVRRPPPELRTSADSPSTRPEQESRQAGSRTRADAWGMAGGVAGPGGICACTRLKSWGGQAAPVERARPARVTEVGLVSGDVYLQHNTGSGHPERPERLTAITGRLKDSGLMAELTLLEPRSVEDEWLMAVHRRAYVAHVRQLCAQGGEFVDARDTGVSPRSYEVARQAAGGVLAAIDAVMAEKVAAAFCAVRPPGHHALPGKAMGFCLFNNVAIAARYVQRKYGLRRVLVVDWDVHHGNGTQAVFDADPTVFYFSVHQSPFYPGTGAADERGTGPGLGTTLNVPLAAGSGDREYAEVFRTRLVPAAAEFRPEFVLISAGFDAHADDPLGGMRVTAAGYAQLTRMVKQIAAEHCRGRLVSVLEGGYGLEGLAASVEAHVRILNQ